MTFAGDVQAQQSTQEAKASFVFNGQRVVIDQSNEEAARFAVNFAGAGDLCGAPCIAPMETAAGVDTLGETELVAFLMDEVAGNTGLLVDARMPEYRARGFIPGSVSLPHSVLGADNAYHDEILEALGALQVEGIFNFTDARKLLVFDTGPSTNEAGDLIARLLGAGYPAEKIKYYRGGMQVWAVLGFSIQEGGA